MAEQTRPAGAVFLSYASEDAEAAARICESLRAAGVEVWFDRDELRGGDAWDSKIKKQIHDCALFVPLISAHTNARSEGYFRREWRQATRRLQDMADDVAFLVPVVIDDVREAQARVPEEYLGVQWSRLPDGETPPAFTDHVCELLGHDPAAALTAPTVAADTSKSNVRKPALGRQEQARQLRWFGLSLAALLLLGLGGWLWWYYEGISDAPATTASPAPGDAVQDRSIAVLPFVNMSSDKEQEYFSDGLSEELLNLLATIPELRVAARTSSFYFKGKDVKLPDIARELRVAYLLEGSVRKSGDRVRITAQLIRGSDGYHQWSKTYDRTLEDVFAVQEEISAAVVSQLKISLLGTQIKARTTSPEAYAMYLQAFQFDSLGEGRFKESNALYRKVLELDPDYTPALVLLGANYAVQADRGILPLEEGMKQAREMVNKAIAVEPDYGLAHAFLGYLALTYDLDLAAAAQHFERALELSPTDFYTLALAANLNDALGKQETAIPLAEYLVSRDPMDTVSHDMLGTAYQRAGRYDDAVASFRTALQLSPEGQSPHGSIGSTLFLEGNYEGALREFESEPSDPFRLAGLAMTHYVMGNKSAADSALSELIENHSHWATHIAKVFALRQDRDRAFEWLERAIKVRDSTLLNVSTTVFLKNLHDDPRWLPFLRKLGRAPEQLAVIQFELKVPTH